MKLLTLSEAAHEFWLPRKTIATWVHRQILKPTQPGLYLDEDVAEVEARLRRVPRWAALIAQAAELDLR